MLSQRSKHMAQLGIATPLTRPGARTSGARPHIREEAVLVGAVALALATLALVPLIGTLFGSFWSQSIIRPGGFLTLDNWPRVLSSTSFLQALWNSIFLICELTPVQGGIWMCRARSSSGALHGECAERR
jgi:ABC-type Fe3+ transport system permease subunit